MARSPIPRFDPRLVDRRTPTQIDAERKRVADQITQWRRTQHDPTQRSKDVAVLRGRRAGRPDLLQFEPVDQGGSDTFVVPGHVLIARENMDDGARRALARRGVTEPPVEELGGRVLRYTVPAPTTRSATGAGGAAAASATPTRDLLAALRAEGVTAHAHYVVPLGMIRKAQGGPEPSSWTQSRPANPVGGPTVAVVDTGISTEVRSDGWLNGLALGDNIDRLDVLPQPTDHRLDLAAGHGTFAAGAAQQVAPSIALRMYQTLDTDGLASETDVAAAIVRAAQDGHQIVNLSLGTDTVDDRPPAALRAGVEQAIAVNPDILLVCAAGNLGDTRPVWPAAFHTDFPDNVVSVAALGRNDQTGAIEGAAWSSHGDVTCSTMGEAVVSTYVIGTESTAADTDPDTFGPDAWATWSGTSFAAPQIVGAVVATMQEQPGRTPRQALDAVLRRGAPLAGYGTALIILPT